MKRIVLLTGVLAATMSGFAQTEVVSGVMRGKDYGVTYALPKTYIEIEAKVNKVNYTPGEFAKYADRYLRLKNVSTEPEEYYDLTGVAAKITGVPDKENVYFVKMKDRTTAPLIELTDDGLIKSINVPRSSSGQTTATPAEAAKRKALDPRDFLTEEILTANSTAKMAELVAKEIYSIRESKNALVRGQADFMPKDGEQMKLMLEALEDQEKALTEMFAGHYDIDPIPYTIRVAPKKELDKAVAFRFSKKLGIVGNNDLSGEPIYISIKDLKTVSIPEEDNKKKVDGVAYNVPGRAMITLTKDRKILLEEEMPITQFGTVEYLAPALFNKNSTIKVIFNPATGGLSKVDREEGK